jgi:3-oxoacyl-[acyl-carrier protein] reductase
MSAREDRDGGEKRCLVSGGTRGLGSALVENLLADGWRVATFGRSESPAIAAAREKFGAQLHFAPVDAADCDAVGRFAAAAGDRFGGLDALVNNAAVGVEGILTLTRASDLHAAIAVNLESAVVLAQAASKFMLRQHGGHIINISSINGIRGQRGVAVYSATKAGLDGLTRSLARELGGRGIRVNSVAPGYLATDMTKGLSDERKQQIIRRTPLGRLGTVDDVVGVVRFLLSPAAGFVTGQTIVVDGGLTC